MSVASARAQSAPGSEEVTEEGRMSLFEHLAELRSRLLRVTIAVLGLGIASLVFAKPIFGLLMRPVLEALPADARSLIYTSGIEEINVLMKVGLYCGLFLSTPVLLWQLWSFVSPGLYPSERKLAAPFVVFGTLAFVVGALFCYFALLPTMFQFLLREGDSAALESRLTDARAAEQDALRYLRLGDPKRAGRLAEIANGSLGAMGEGQVEIERTPDLTLEMRERIDGLGRLLDAAGQGVGNSGRPVLRSVLDAKLLATEAHRLGNDRRATQVLDDAAGQLAGLVPSATGELQEIWKLEKAVAAGHARYQAQTWTRPMLTMREQLSLVLILELAFGIIFELPLVMALLGVVGVIQSRWLFKYQRHAFVVCLIAAAIITPTGDVVNLSLMAGPMLLCYELGVLLVWLVERRRARNSTSTVLSR